jgi:hypothetical protein
MDVPHDVETPQTQVSADPTSGAAADQLARFRRRGRRLFTFLAFFSVIVGSIAIVLGATQHPLRSVIVAAIGVVIVLLVAVALVFGLAEGRAWADRATVLVCWIFLVAGVLRVVLRLTMGTVEIPLDAIGAALVLAVRPSTFAPSLRGDGRRIGLVAAASLVAAVAPLISDGVASGRILGANPDQVAVVVTVDCTGIAADPTAPVVVRASWTWTGSELLAGGEDGFVVAWNAARIDHQSDGDSLGTMFEDVEAEVASPDAVWRGSGTPASVLTEPIEAGSDGNARSFGIDVARAGLVDGHVAMWLRPRSPDARHGSIEVSAYYAHLDRWLTESDQAVCQW